MPVNREPVLSRCSQLLGLLFAAGLALALVSPTHAQDVADGAAPPAAAINTKGAVDTTLKHNYTQSAIPLNIVLAPVADAEKVALTEGAKGQPLQIGFGRAIPAPYQGDIQPLLEWVKEADGTETAVFTVTSPGAQALRLALDVTDLPDGVELRFFSLAMPTQVFGPFTVRDMWPESKEAVQTAAEVALYWSPVIEGDTIGVELWRTKPAQQTGFVLEISQVSHIFYSVLESVKSLSNIGSSGSCNIDVLCRTVADAIRAATAKIIYTLATGVTRLCTGTLMNDLDSDSFIPYFLTANHCFGTQSVADTVNSYWLFERATCGGPNPTSVIQRTGGGELLATGTNTDFTFMQLNDEVSTISGVMFAGWDANPLAASSSIVSIHHPMGDLKKWSQGTSTGFADFEGVVNGTGSYLHVLWSQGTTEDGSSGSGLFDTSNRLRGTLRGGFASCSALRSPDYYGRFDLTFPSVQQWLSTGATRLTSGRAVTDAVQQGRWKEYKITASATETQFRVRLSGLNQNADLYIRKGSRSTLAQYDCRSLTGGTSSEMCSFSNNGSNVYYISVRGASAGTTSFTIAATAPPNGVIDTPTGDVTIIQGQVVNFSGTGTDLDGNTPLTFAWDFGGGAPNSTQEDPGNVTFNTVGTFTVTFTVTDSLGAADPTPPTRMVTVTAPVSNGGGGGGGCSMSPGTGFDPTLVGILGLIFLAMRWQRRSAKSDDPPATT